MPTFTTSQKRTAIEREITMRERVFVRRIRDQKMTQTEADYELAIMREILLDYAAAEHAGSLL